MAMHGSFPNHTPLLGLPPLPHFALMVRRKAGRGLQAKDGRCREQTKRGGPHLQRRDQVVHVIKEIEGAGEINTASMQNQAPGNEDRGEGSTAGTCLGLSRGWKPDII